VRGTPKNFSGSNKSGRGIVPIATIVRAMGERNARVRKTPVDVLV
jgi:hypothetical protein